MKFLRERVLKGETMFGVAAQLGSALTVEMIGRAGFDWTWIDCEHGSGDYSELIHQIQVARLGDSPAVVRIAWNEPTRFKRVLDLGAAGIMVPYVNTAAEAHQAAQSMRYQPEGIRGVAGSPPACGFGQGFDDYYAKANDNLLTVVQIETVEGVKNADEIAAVPGVDVLFVGPMDLSINMGMPRQFKDAAFEANLERVVAACRKHGKAAGILTPTLDYLAPWKAKGYSFFVVGSDSTNLAKLLVDLHAKCAELKG
ncbi:HpcH/HpaI aldolase family protein [Shumkonia mesophila]|uniref:HpcH/HpaI aldolase family protein n=1 Tax=Shumkonia mesophila TaxID=2838854 RepID=UPI0029344442|nr:aldolase/citrate lyase family protein [Shumkonia mesophila]